MNSIKRSICLLLTLVLLCSAIPVTGFAKGEIIQGIGFITGSSVRLRKEASTTSSVITATQKNDVVVVMEQVDDWYRVIYNLKTGYIHSDYLVATSTEDAELGYGRINGTNVNLRSGAGTGHSKISRGTIGDKAYILGVQDGWYRVIFNGRICYIRSDYLDLTEVPYENQASSNSPKFYRGGQSLGVEPSAGALNGSSAPETAPEATEAPTTPPQSAPSTTTPSTTPPSNSSTTSKDVKYGIGFTTGSGLRLRGEASTSSRIIDSANKNEVVVVLDKVGDWYKVIYDLQEGYMHGDYLRVNTAENAELGYGNVNASDVNFRSGPDSSSSSVAIGSQGDKAYIIGINNGWYKVIFGDHVCYVRSDYLTLTEKPYENKASTNSPKFYRGGKSLGVEPSAAALNGTTSSGNSASGSSGSTGSSSSSSNSSSSSSSLGSGSTATPSTPSGSVQTGSVTGDQIAAKAKQYLGVPYLWGGTSPNGFDCSGFVYYVMNTMGIKISRTIPAMYTQGKAVSKSDLQPGDVVFFQNTYKEGLSHVGIYVGNGQFIHSPQSGQVVSFANLESSYYVKHYYGAVRYTK